MHVLNKAVTALSEPIFSTGMLNFLTFQNNFCLRLSWNDTFKIALFRSSLVSYSNTRSRSFSRSAKHIHSGNAIPNENVNCYLKDRCWPKNRIEHFFFWSKTFFLFLPYYFSIFANILLKDGWEQVNERYGCRFLEI